jgi:hypothetical protein
VPRGAPGLPRQEAPEKFCFVIGVVPRFGEALRFRRTPNLLAKTLASKIKFPCVVWFSAPETGGSLGGSGK